MSVWKADSSSTSTGLYDGGFIQPGAVTGPVGITWMNSYFDEEIASGVITADMRGIGDGWFCIHMEELDQRIFLDACPRHFGGRQWYFICPYLNCLVSVLWMPPGARDFACREWWGRAVAYASQFLDRNNRAHRGKANINARLCAIGGFDPDEWDLPPKPKWMRWRTYNRSEEKFERYESRLDEGVAKLVARLRIGI